MGTHARLTITTAGTNGEPRTWVFARSHDGYPDHTMPVLQEFLNRTKREARPPATRDEAEGWLNDAERTDGAKTRDDAAQWPDAWWIEATQPHTPAGPITHVPAGDVSHTYHVDLRTPDQELQDHLDTEIRLRNAHPGPANPNPLPPIKDLMQWTKRDLADTAITAEAEREKARNESDQAKNALYKALADLDDTRNSRAGWEEEAKKQQERADHFELRTIKAEQALADLRDRVYKALAPTQTQERTNP